LSEIMTKILVALLALLLLTTTAMTAAPAAGDVMAPIRQLLAGFNNNDMKAANAAYATGDVTIVDEFAPHLWSGPHAAQEWADAYDKHAAATGVTDGIVKLGTPTRTEVELDSAYVIVPAVYNYKEHGVATTEEGQMTFVLRTESGVWKITGWTWTGVKPHPAK
jgi:hypothetical protein